MARRRHGARDVRLPRRRSGSACIGGSYGGFMTSWIVGAHEPLQGRGLRARGQPPRQHVRLERPLLDLRAPVRRPDVRQRRRVARAARRRRTRRTSRRRVLVLHSENDLRCNIEQGEHLFTLLRLLGKEVEMLRFPGREPRALARRLADPPRAAVRGDPRVVRALPELASRARKPALRGFRHAGRPLKPASFAAGRRPRRLPVFQWTIESSGLRLPGLKSVPIVYATGISAICVTSS